MSIQSIVASAEKHFASKEYEDALRDVLTAAMGSSAKTYPTGTMSFINPKKKMDSCEAFKRFLNPLINLYLLGHSEPSISKCGFMTSYDDRTMEITEMLYIIRCSLEHEAELPEVFAIKIERDTIRFTGSEDDAFSIGGGSKHVDIGIGTIKKLIEFVKIHPTNQDIFPGYKMIKPDNPNVAITFDRIAIEQKERNQNG
jgi:hypothetical protein